MHIFGFSAEWYLAGILIILELPLGVGVTEIISNAR